MFYQEESVYLQEFAYFKQDCCRIKRIVYIKYWCYRLVRNGKVFLSSNNLGDNNRFSKYFVLEHRMEFFNKKLDITPGVATYFSDFNFLLFQRCWISIA
jgi:hypothetical protein